MKNKKGYASRTLLAVSRYLLTEYQEDIHKILLMIDPDNTESIALAERCGFYTFDTPF